MPQIQFDPKFFRKEREQNYTNWPLANWRELFQNSIDQNATEIHIGLVPQGDCVLLTFTDNGPGMTRTTLNDVYFKIGASTKDNDPTKIGGMGRARILTCFAMKSYRIYSQDYQVVGAGLNYEVYDHAWTRGCKLVVEVDDVGLSALSQALTRFLFESRISARVFLNGERQIVRSLNAGRHVRDLQARGQSFARVFVNKSAEVSRVIVRVNGVSMFTTSTNANAQVIVEIEPSVSRSVLTANRDGLRGDYREAVDRFLRELAVDTNSALRSKFNRRTTVARGGGMKVARPVKRAGGATEVATFVGGAKAPEFRAAALYDPGVATNTPEITETTTYVRTFDAWLADTFGDIYIYDEADQASMRKTISAYLPENWVTGVYKSAHTGRAPRAYRKGGNIIRLLLLWQTAINYTLEVALGPLEQREISFAVGFTFGEMLASHREQDGGHVFCLRPVNRDGKLDFKTSNRRDLKRLMAYAKHEVTHIATDWHGEHFSSLRETVDIEFDETECLRRMKAALQIAKQI